MMTIVVEYEVPEDDDFEAGVTHFENEGDWPGLMEMAACCPMYTVRVERS